MVRDTCLWQFKIFHKDGKTYQEADALLRAYYMKMMNVITINTGSYFRNFLVEDELLHIWYDAQKILDSDKAAHLKAVLWRFWLN